MYSKTFVRSAFTAALLCASPVIVPALTGQVSPASASVNVSVNIGTFYDRLADDGDWVWMQGNYVWVPERVGMNWRPYTVGHWVWTDDYGWMWISEERFGWATYHYGRWGYSNALGWYWVPGRRWGPAWVSWRNDDANIAWAPLPPGGDDLSINVNFNTLPDYYWNVVQTRNFLAPTLSVSLIFDQNERRRVFSNGRPGNVVIRNNIVVNNFIGVDFIGQRTGRKIQPMKVVGNGQPGRAQLKGNEVSAFMATVDPDAKMKPKRIVEAKNVKVKTRVQGKEVPEVGFTGNGQPGSGKQNGQAGGNGQNGPDGQNAGPGKKGKKPVLGTDQTGNGMNPDGTAAGQPGNKKNKKKQPVDATQQNGVAQPGQPIDGGQVQQPNAKKLKRQQQGGGQDNTLQMNNQGNGEAPLTQRQKKRLQMQQQMQQGGGVDQNGMGNQMGGQNQRQKRLQQQMQQGGPDQNGMGNQMGGQNQRQKRLQQQQMQQGGGNQNGMGGNQMGGQRNKKKLQACDPQTDPSCMPQ